jgi:hypothetical protein
MRSRNDGVARHQGEKEPPLRVALREPIDKQTLGHHVRKLAQTKLLTSASDFGGSEQAGRSSILA